MSLLDLIRGRNADKAPQAADFADVLEGYSIEIMPRTAAKIEDFKALLPAGTRVYIAHIEGTPIDEMVETARRLGQDGYPVMPHFPARIIPDVATLETWIARYRDEAGVDQALLLAGGVANAAGTLDSSMQMMETGLFDKYGYKRLHVAGHPEGNRDIDADGGTRIVDEALSWKQQFAQRTDAEMAIATQFAFDAEPIATWAERVQAAGIDLPIHLGIAGPTKLQTLLKFAVACGVGPSIKVLQKRAMDVTKLLVPYEPTEVLAEIADYRKANPQSRIEKIHVFPLGGIRASAEWMNAHGGGTPVAG